MNMKPTNPCIECDTNWCRAQSEGKKCPAMFYEKPRPHGEWIPCSERLPKAGQVVIVSDVRGDVYEYTMNPLNVDKYIDDKWTFMGYEILAWMPLPEPYRKEGEEK